MTEVTEKNMFLLNGSAMPNIENPPSRWAWTKKTL